jgi:CHAT domain-containing protein/tetratricopeptide (TPR) repeat protein
VVRVVVEQRGVDVALEVFDPDGGLLIRADRPIAAHSAERVTILAAQPGSHRLEVGEAGDGTPGRYLLRVVDGPRPAGEPDRLRAAAERLFYAARFEEKKRTRAGWAAAAKGYEEALRLWTGAGDRHGRAIAGARLGEVLGLLEERQRAEAELTAALPLLVAEGELNRAAEVHNSLGAVARAAVDYDAAAEHYRRAMELAAETGNDAAQARALENRGVLGLYRGEIASALDDLAAARDGWRRLDEPENEVGVLLRIGAAYLQAGEAGLAAAPLEQAYDLAARERLEVEAARALAQLAAADVLRGDLDRGVELLERAIPVFESKRLRGDLARALNELGQIHRQTGRYEEALAELGRAAELFTEPRDVAMMRMHIAWTLEGMGEAGRALDVYPGLLDEFRRLDDPDLVASVHYGWARAALGAGRLEEALGHIEQAIAQVERRRRGFAERSLGTAYGSRKSDYYRVEVEILMRLDERDPAAGWDRRAVAASESGRARQLVASLTAARSGPPPLVDPELDAARHELYRTIRGLEYALVDTGGAGTTGGLVLVHRLRRLRAAAERLETRIVDADPRLATLAEPPFDLARFRAALDPGTVVLVLSLGERRSWLWRITRDGLTSHPLPDAETLDRVAADAHRMLARSRERRAAAEVTRALQALSDLLLGPVAESLEAERLVMVADGAMHYVPLAALPAPAGAPGPAGPLLDRLETVGLPSLAVLDELRRLERGRPQPPGVLAVVADPVTAATDDRLPAAVRRPPDAKAPRLPDELAALAADLGVSEFARLFWAGPEADAILALAPADRRWDARSFEAHREAILDAPLGRYRYLHFAVHVVPDESRPYLSGLVLSRFTPDGAPRGGLLRLADVFALDLPVDLVVLSGCRSGRGKELRGEGIVGLTRGFMAAGAPRVVVSLWDVNDHATKELMVAFYDGLLRRGLRPGAALRAAQQTVRAEPAWQAPYYWAGFVLQGDWR